jgi:hypothetical protein
MQVHHLTYLFGYGNPPLFVLRPMCPLCHRIETALTRIFFGEGFARRSRLAHLWMTYGVRWIVNLVLITGILLGLFKVGVI